MAITIKECKWCGKEFLGTASAKFCCSYCRLKNHRKENKNA